MKNRTGTVDTFVANLRALMRATDIKKPELAKKSGVSERMIGYILAKERTPTIEVADSLGKPFGVTGWQMIVPDLPVHLAKSGQLERLIKNYSALPEEERKYLDHVAEREAKYLAPK